MEGSGVGDGKGWFLGAYAGNASFADKSPENEAFYLQGLQELPHLAGLELPFYNDLSESGSDKFLRTLPKDWEYVLTLLPGTMQSLSKYPEFGLASKSSEGRKAAMSRMTIVHRRVHEINSRCGWQAVRGIEVHSAPAGPLADAQALYASLRELETWDWQGARLMLEHCDEWKPDGSSVKGFLPLRDELGVVKELGLDLSLNWGRSALEGRSAEAPLEQLRLAQGADRLGAFFFSGTAVNDRLYGSWTDAHVPLRLESAAPWAAEAGILTPSHVTAICKALANTSDALLGIKVQPAPASLSLSERLGFLKEQILAFEAARRLA